MLSNFTHWRFFFWTKIVFFSPFNCTWELKQHHGTIKIQFLCRSFFFLSCFLFLKKKEFFFMHKNIRMLQFLDWIYPFTINYGCCWWWFISIKLSNELLTSREREKHRHWFVLCLDFECPSQTMFLLVVFIRKVIKIKKK